MAPITIPAIAPADIPLWCGEGGGGGNGAVVFFGTVPVVPLCELSQFMTA
jgi:hypothetical protein